MEVMAMVVIKLYNKQKKQVSEVALTDLSTRFHMSLREFLLIQQRSGRTYSVEDTDYGVEYDVLLPCNILGSE